MFAASDSPPCKTGPDLALFNWFILLKAPFAIRYELYTHHTVAWCSYSHCCRYSTYCRYLSYSC